MFTHIFIFLMIFSLSPLSLGYDFLALSLSWPKGYCATLPCTSSPPPNIFTLHGLWPSNINQTDPQSCPHTIQFPDNSVIEKTWNHDLLTNMKKITFSPKTQFSLWKHEWTFHGTCMESKSVTHSQLDAADPQAYYFDSIYAYFKNANDLVSKLAGEANVKPGQEYDAITLLNAVNKVIGSDVSIKCRVSSHDNKQHLVEVILYLDKNLQHTNVFDAVAKFRSRCDMKKKIIYAGSHLRASKELYLMSYHLDDYIYSA
ncbi:putative ribonuclease T(2) [Lupinus albus]|uniref:Putative ribonuclease T(2) n=1 Tax=Lupinus albus TaxID=3870 RepID=A0A6A4PKN6_LUPAL|nr:putative ribonuclease T(2) [Lupinus albus]